MHSWFPGAISHVIRAVFWVFVTIPSAMVAAQSQGSTTTLSSLPQEMTDGLIRYALETDNPFDALVLVDKQAKNRNRIAELLAYQAFGMPNIAGKGLSQLEKTKPKLSNIEKYQLGKLYYERGECIASLKAFNSLKSRIPETFRERQVYYRSHCILALGGPVKAAQALSQPLSGQWVASAYYNLAMEYASRNVSKTKALVSLRVAKDLNYGDSSYAEELNDRIHLAAGKLYLDSEKPTLASDFLKKVRVDSLFTAQAQYLLGLSYIQQQDFRGATQIWSLNKKFPLIAPGVAESYLGTPFAFEGAGYAAQALEAYVEASDIFKAEIETITNITGLIEKYSTREVLLEDSKKKDLQWFLKQDVARNTQRAAYYKAVLDDADAYRLINLYYELESLHSGLNYWLTQFEVFEAQLASRIKTSIKKQSKALARLTSSQKKLVKRTQSNSIAAKSASVARSVETIAKRAAYLKSALASEVLEKDYRPELKRLKNSIKKRNARLVSLLSKLDQEIDQSAIRLLRELNDALVVKYEKAEQGLIHTLEVLAEARTRRTNRLDGRYQ